MCERTFCEEKNQGQSNGIEEIPIVCEKPKKLKFADTPIKKFQVFNVPKSQPVQKMLTQTVLFSKTTVGSEMGMGNVQKSPKIHSKLPVKESQKASPPTSDLLMGSGIGVGSVEKSPTTLVKLPLKELQKALQHIDSPVVSDNIASKNTQQPTNISHPSHLTNPELRYVARRLASIDLKMDKMLKIISPDIKINISLPLCSTDEVDELHEKLNSDSDGSFAIRLINSVSKYSPVCGQHATSGLSKIMLDSLVINNYNWDGIGGKIALKGLKLFNTVLFEAWKKNYEGNYQIYEVGMRKQIADCRNREYTRRKRRLDNSPDKENI